MKLKPIITSLLETDLYKFSMGQAIYHQFPSYKTRWTRIKDIQLQEISTEEVIRKIYEGEESA